MLDKKNYILSVDDNGYTKVPNEILRGDVDLTVAELRVFANLLSHRDGFDLSNTIIEKQTGLSKKTVISAINGLESKRFLTVEREPGKNNVFKINPPTDWLTSGENALVEKLHCYQCNNSTTTSGEITPMSIYNNTIKKTNEKTNAPKVQKTTTPKKSEYTEQFEQVWAIWPKKDAKAASFREFKKSMSRPGVTFALIVEAIRAYIDAAQNDSNYPQYVHSLRTAFSDGHLMLALERSNQSNKSKLSFKL